MKLWIFERDGFTQGRDRRLVQRREPSFGIHGLGSARYDPKILCPGRSSGYKSLHEVKQRLAPHLNLVFRGLPRIQGSPVDWQQVDDFVQGQFIPAFGQKPLEIGSGGNESAFLSSGLQ